MSNAYVGVDFSEGVVAIYLNEKIAKYFII